MSYTNPAAQERFMGRRRAQLSARVGLGWKSRQPKSVDIDIKVGGIPYVKEALAREASSEIRLAMRELVDRGGQFFPSLGR